MHVTRRVKTNAEKIGEQARMRAARPPEFRCYFKSRAPSLPSGMRLPAGLTPGRAPRLGLCPPQVDGRSLGWHMGPLLPRPSCYGSGTPSRRAIYGRRVAGNRAFGSRPSPSTALAPSRWPDGQQSAESARRVDREQHRPATATPRDRPTSSNRSRMPAFREHVGRASASAQGVSLEGDAVVHIRWSPEPHVGLPS